MGGHNKINHDPNWIGKQFNHLTVHEIYHNGLNYLWIMKCQCGTVTNVYNPNVIKKGYVKSCGCMRGKYEKK